VPDEEADTSPRLVLDPQGEGPGIKEMAQQSSEAVLSLAELVV